MGRVHHAPAAAPSTLAADAIAELRRLSATFMAALPAGAYQAGVYHAQDGDAFDGQAFKAPNGRYRVAGAGWIFDIRKGRFLEAVRAVPPKFGGDDVIGVPNG